MTTSDLFHEHLKLTREKSSSWQVQLIHGDNSETISGQNSLVTQIQKILSVFWGSFLGNTMLSVQSVQIKTLERQKIEKSEINPILKGFCVLPKKCHSNIRSALGIKRKLESDQNSRKQMEATSTCESMTEWHDID